jgi:hypothetical protein
MAARTRKIRHDEQTRAKIRASQLINVLQKHALKGGDLAATRIKSAEILLDRVLPKLAQQQLTNGEGGPLAPSVVVVLPDNGRDDRDDDPGEG